MYCKKVVRTSRPNLLKNNVSIFTRVDMEDTGEKDVTQRDVDFGEHVQLAPGPL